MIGRTKLRMLAALLLLAAPAARGEQPPPPPAAEPEEDERAKLPIVYSVPGMDGVQVRRDLVYTKIDDPNMRMDVYVPPGLAAGGGRPAVLFIHGGASTADRLKDWEAYRSWGRLVAASGLVGVTFTHRLGYPKTMVLEGASDVADAIAYVRSHAAELGVDKDRLCLAVYSAGGPMLGPYLSDAPPYVRCLLAFYPFMDVRQTDRHRASETAETLDRFSPIVQIAKTPGRVPPLFLARAGKDQIPTLLDSVDRFVAEALARNVPLTLVNHPEGDHGFDIQNPDARSREILRQAVEFLQSHLGVAP